MTRLIERLMEWHERCICYWCCRYRFDPRHVSLTWFGYCHD